MAALGAELSRCDVKTRDAATQGLRDYVGVLASHPTALIRVRQEPGHGIFATMVGALVLARMQTTGGYPRPFFATLKR